MTCALAALCLEARDPSRVARFWAGLLGWAPAADGRPDVAALRPTDDTGFGLRFVPSPREKVRQNRMHLDLTSTSLEDQRRTVDRALDLGGRHLDVGQRPEEGHVVLADPEGNELCVIGPGNAFLADCGFVGALACDGSQEVGYFWSRALGWPLVWDQDQETAVRSPHAGPKITWGGPPLPPRTVPNRLQFELAVDDQGQLPAEVERLVSLGAARSPTTLGDRDGVALVDPDDNEFRVTVTTVAPGS